MRDQIIRARTPLIDRHDRQAAYRGLAHEANQVLFVGDSPFDLRAGRAAGTHTAAALWGPFSREVLAAEEPDFYLSDLEGVLHTSPSRS